MAPRQALMALADYVVQSGDVMHPLVQFARDAVQLFVREGGILTVDERSLPEEFRTQAGVFVCLKIKGRLPGLHRHLPARGADGRP